MFVNILAFTLILLALLFTTVVLNGMSVSSYIIIGAIAGFAAVSITATLVILCSRKHKDVISNENGFKIQTSENNTSTLEIMGHTSASNTYVKTNDIIKYNDNVTLVSSTLPSQNRRQPPENRPQPPQNGSQPSQERKVSIASDNTESHHYTEIDEHFFNKRKEKEQNKLQHRYDNEAFEDDDDTIQENFSQLDSSLFTYDYVYDINPHKK